MSAIDESLFLFADPLIRNIFEVLLKEGQIRVRDLKIRVGDEDQVDAAIRTLTEKKLVAATESPIIDFSTLYPTSEGLGIARKLKVST